MDSYTGRRNTKNKWSYEHYTVLSQLGLGILTYKIQAEGGSTHIVHQNQLFLLLPKEGGWQLCTISSCPLGRDHGFSWSVIRIHALRSEIDPWGVCENIISCWDTWSKVPCLQTRIDPETNRSGMGHALTPHPHPEDLHWGTCPWLKVLAKSNPELWSM